MWEFVTSGITIVLAVWALFRLIGIPQFIQQLLHISRSKADAERLSKIYLQAGTREEIVGFINEYKGYIGKERFDQLLKRLERFNTKQPKQSKQSKQPIKGTLN